MSICLAISEKSRAQNRSEKNYNYKKNFRKTGRLGLGNKNRNSLEQIIIRPNK